jgi:4-amino-4-deoxy-L-arabinose transferase-like glycosyltransferase
VRAPAAAPRTAARTVALLLAALTLVALGLRWESAVRSGMWRDEALFLAIVRDLSPPDMLRFLRHDESHPPLFYLLMRAWLALFGPTDAAALALPVLLGGAAVPAAYAAASRAFGRTAGAVAALLVAVNPLLTGQAGSARPYSLLPLLVFLSVHLLWHALTESGTGGGRADARRWGAYAAVTALALYTHNWAWVAWATSAVGVGLVLAAGWVGGVRRRRVAQGWLGAQAAVFALYAPWLPTLLYQARHAGHSLADRPVGPAATAGFLTDMVSRAWGVPSGLLLAAGLTFVGLAAWAVVRRVAGFCSAPPERAAVVLHAVTGFGAAALPFCLTPWVNLINARCYTAVVPSLLLLAAAAVAAPAAAALQRRTDARAGVLVTVLLAAGLTAGAAHGLYRVRHFGRSNAREIAAAVAQNARPGDLVVVAPEWIASSFNRYFRPSNEQIDFPEMGREQYMRFSDVAARTGDPATLRRAAERIDQARRAGARVWLVTLPRVVRYDVSLGDPLPAGVSPTDYAGVGFFRSEQLAAHLVRRYGPPAAAVEQEDGERRYQERIEAYLFAPGPASPPPPAGDR